MPIVKLYSEAFTDEEFSNKLCVRPSTDLWEKIMNEHQQFDRIFLRIHHPNLDYENFLVAVGDPIAVTSNLTNTLFLPTWILDTNIIHGCGEETHIDIVTPDELPKATKIVIRPIDSLLLDVDIVEQLQPPLSALGCLQQHKQYYIPLASMGGYPVPIFVSKLEPFHEVFLDGDEIPLEFEEAVDSPPRPPTPMPTPTIRFPTPPTSYTEQGAVSVPTEIQGNMIPHESMNQQPNRMLRRTNVSTSSAFVPFSGEGRRLGGP